jgi:cob(I)alamin adenosyltransferase
MEASIERTTDANGHAELHVTLTGTCDESSAIHACRKVSRELESGPVRRVIVETTALQFDSQNDRQLSHVVSVLYIASRETERFQLVDSHARRRQLLELLSTAK